MKALEVEGAARNVAGGERLGLAASTPARAAGELARPRVGHDAVAAKGREGLAAVFLRPKERGRGGGGGKCGGGVSMNNMGNAGERRGGLAGGTRGGNGTSTAPTDVRDSTNNGGARCVRRHT